MGLAVIPHSATLGYSTLLDSLRTQALVDLDSLMVSTAGESLDVQREALMDVLPVLGDQYVGATSLVSAEFFTELQAMNEIKKPIAAEVMDGVGAARWRSLAGWGTKAATFEQGAQALMYSLLSGGFTKILTESAADTMVGNAEFQGGMRAQRVPSVGCCAFCGLLASRGAAYSSSSGAGVVGRGKPLGSHRLARGIRPRGAQAIGEDFHDHCRCTIVTVTAGNEVELQETADKYYDSYRGAADKINDGLTLSHTESMQSDGTRNRSYEWVNAAGDARSSKETTADILAAMRLDLGIK